MEDIFISDMFAEMWRSSRESAGKSQDYMAKALGVSKKTVQNWEQGTSCPSQITGFKWFRVLGVQPLPYYLSIIYPDVFGSLKNNINDKGIEDALVRIVKDMPSRSQRELLYVLSGMHGSSVIGILEMITAHLQSPLRDRLNIAQSIAINYEIARSVGCTRQPEHIQPDMDFLYRSIDKGKDAVLKGKKDYAL